MNKRHLFLLLISFFTFPFLYAQYDAHLTGHVLDAETGEHLPFVNVQLKGTNIGTVTDESGHYLLKDLPLGKTFLWAAKLSSSVT